MFGKASTRITPDEKRAIVASSLGTVFEWYDFILFGSLAPIIAQQFFTKADPATGLIFALLAFSAGFIVRPFGALVFGRLGDVVGRKYTFLVTILIMGLATFVVGLLPNYDAIGIAAPIILIGLRLLQGLAVGGEYGGAVVYVAEHAPTGRRGEFTGWIQTTGTAGFLLSLLIILGTRTGLGETAFVQWGWRIPFLVSIVLLGISVWIRLKMQESPVFSKMKAQGRVSKAPLSEAFARWGNLKVVLIALFGVVAGFAVVWYAAQFYVLLFLTQTLKVEGATANVLVVTALLAATPFFVIFGALSDRIGRKKIILGGMLLAALTYHPIFKALTHYANPALEQALASAPVVVSADPNDCQFQFNLTGTRKFTSSCDIAKAKLVAASVNYANESAPAGSIATVRIGDTLLTAFDMKGLSRERGGGETPCVHPGAECSDPGRRLPGQSRSAADQQDNGGAADFRDDPVPHHGLRARGCVAGGNVPDPHSLHLVVPALSPRLRVDRRHDADGCVCDGCLQGRHLLRPVVPGRRRHRLGLDRGCVRQGNERHRYQCMSEARNSHASGDMHAFASSVTK